MGVPEARLLCGRPVDGDTRDFAGRLNLAFAPKTLTSILVHRRLRLKSLVCIGLSANGR
jgi:hypothetical protein